MVPWVRMMRNALNMMLHEVCYDPTNVDSQTYKIYLNLFDTGSVEQWLKFQTKLNLIIAGQSDGQSGKVQLDAVTT